MATVGINPVGLKKKPTYNELVNYIEDDPDKIKFPDRTAKYLRNSFQLSQLDGYGMQEMENQQLQAMKQQMRDQEISRLADHLGVSASSLRTAGNELSREASVSGGLSPPEVRSTGGTEYGSIPSIPTDSPQQPRNLMSEFASMVVGAARSSAEIPIRYAQQFSMATDDEIDDAVAQRQAEALTDEYERSLTWAGRRDLFVGDMREQMLQHYADIGIQPRSVVPSLREAINRIPPHAFPNLSDFNNAIQNLRRTDPVIQYFQNLPDSPDTLTLARQGTGASPLALQDSPSTLEQNLESVMEQEGYGSTSPPPVEDIPVPETPPRETGSSSSPASGKPRLQFSTALEHVHWQKLYNALVEHNNANPDDPIEIPQLATGQGSGPRNTSNLKKALMTKYTLVAPSSTRSRR